MRTWQQEAWPPCENLGVQVRTSRNGEAGRAGPDRLGWFCKGSEAFAVSVEEQLGTLRPWRLRFPGLLSPGTRTGCFQTT